MDERLCEVVVSEAKEMLGAIEFQFQDSLGGIKLGFQGCVVGNVQDCCVYCK